MSDAQTSFGRFVLACLLVVATLGFGLAGLCGGVFTLAALPELFAKGPENYSAAMLVISVPLSETMVLGFPRPAMRLSSSRASRAPDSDVSATRQRHSRVKSSTTARTRKRRPSVKASLTK